MNLDIIIGNPPYNNYIDLDFTLKSKSISKYVCMITPAKWKTSYNDKAKYFRERIEKFITKVVYYPDTKDIFHIALVDGISYYLIDNVIHNLVEIKNKCNVQKYFNSIKLREMNMLHNVGNEIINSMGEYKRFEFIKYKEEGKYTLYMNHHVVIGGDNKQMKTFLLSNSGNTKVLGKQTIYVGEPDKSEKSSLSKKIYQSDNIEELKNYISFLNTKLVRFLVLINISKLSNILDNDTFKYVPYMHKGLLEAYTDEEMYTKYNLSKDQVKIIESIIKERS